MIDIMVSIEHLIVTDSLMRSASSRWVAFSTHRGMDMRAAVVLSPSEPPIYGTYDDPVAAEGQSVIEVLAAPLSPIVRSIASGRHYSSASDVPKHGYVPGVDGVGINAAGERVYFLFPKVPFGSMAQYALVSTTSTVPVPDGISSERAAAVVTGGLSAWVALRERARFVRGESVVINGATGSAGRLAVQIARYLGASRVIATGRDKAKLAMLPSDVETIALDDNAELRLREIFRDPVDVVLDYLWGAPGELIIDAASHARGSRQGEPRLRYVQIGSIAGESITLKGSQFRSSGLEILGSGIGSLSMQQLVNGAGELLQATPRGEFDLPIKVMPLSMVSDGWREPDDEARIVFSIPD